MLPTASTRRSSRSRASAGSSGWRSCQTPSGRDVVESGGFVTRDAREVDGLVDWLYPNSPALALESGRHVLRFTALGAAAASSTTRT